MYLGASAASKAFTPEILKEMADLNERPVIFALSNPTSKAECTAEEAYVHTEGRVIFSSGSPFGSVTYNGKTYTPGQGNNAYIFPGVALGVIVTGIHHISDEIFLIAAQRVADHVTDADLEKGSLYPPLSKIKDCSIDIAVHISQYAYNQGIASTYPEPVDKTAFVKAQMYDYYYDTPLPTMYEWPKTECIEYTESTIESGFEFKP